MDIDAGPKVMTDEGEFQATDEAVDLSSTTVEARIGPRSVTTPVTRPLPRMTDRTVSPARTSAPRSRASRARPTVRAAGSTRTASWRT